MWKTEYRAIEQTHRLATDATTGNMPDKCFVLSDNRVVVMSAGFSLVELLVAVTLFALVGSMALLSFVSGQETRNRAMARLEIFETARTVMDIMANDIGNANLRPSDTLVDTQDVRISARLPDAIMDNDFRPYSSSDNRRGRLRVVDWPSPPGGLNPGYLRGDGIDNDGDGLIDEEAFDGLDNDGDGLIDEDVFYPRDMINLMTPQGALGELVEVGYSIDPQGRNLYRRFATTDRAHSNAQPIDGVYFSLGEFDQNMAPTIVDDDGNLAPEYEHLPGYRPQTIEDGVFEHASLVAMGVVGLDFRMYYQDYAILRNIQNAGDRDAMLPVPGPDRSILGDAQMTYNQYGVPMLSWDSSFEQGNMYANHLATYFGLNIIPCVLPNGPDDMELFRILNDPSYDGHTTRENAEVQAYRQTDGLPRVIDITLFLRGSQEDDTAEVIPVWRRVYLPQAAGDDS